MKDQENSFEMSLDWKDMIEEMDDKGRSELLLAIMRYQAGEDVPENMCENARVAFAYIEGRFCEAQGDAESIETEDYGDVFVLYKSYKKPFELLSYEQRGILITAILSYVNGCDLPEMDPPTDMAFSFIKERMERDREEYLI